jgi:2-iminobutanoate/2-iminopropanoate deaminase
VAPLTVVFTPDAPLPAGHYSQAVVHQGVVYVAGQLPARPGQAEHRPGTIEEQAGQALANLDAILRAAGSRRDLVLRVTVYLADLALWGRVNQLYAAFFGEHRPARTVVPVGKLHYGYDIELDAVAAVAPR